MTNRASGRRFISLMPPSEASSFSRSRRRPSTSCLTSFSNVPSVSAASSSFRRATDFFTVAKLVSVPPSQRWVMNGMPQRSASSFTASRALRLVPRNRMVPRFCATPEMKFIASLNSGTVFSRLMMWILPRAPKMYGAILGFQ